MMVSTRGRYALQVLIDLAEHAETGFTPMKEVAERQDISLKYLERILPLLTKSEIVEGVQGKGGGYRLVKQPKDITVLEILTLMEGDLAPVSCLECDAAPCGQSSQCRIFHMWNKFYEMINEYFGNITIADLMENGICEEFC